MASLTPIHAPPLDAGDTVVVAFSGGLDTSFCVLFLREVFSVRVVTVTVDTGGFDAAETTRIAERSAELGAAEHRFVDGRQAVYDDHISWLIRGNVLRGGVYPLCVGAERVVQAREAARVAREVSARAIVHGSTGAGNDQVRFEVAISALCPSIPSWSPIRDMNVRRTDSAAWLAARGFPVSAATKEYSINAGLWGVTIGGRETHDPWAYPPETAWPTTADPSQAPASGEEMTIGFGRGLPVALDGQPLPPLELLESLRSRASRHGVGRGIHLGDTILGIKGRIAFEAAAAAVLVPAHRELEKLVLTREQQLLKAHLAELYGVFLHEARFFDPVVRDVEAFFASTQMRVEGDVRVRVRQGSVEVRGVRSPYTLMAPELARYGEENALWDGRDAAGFTKIYGTQQLLAGLAARRAGG